MNRNIFLLWLILITIFSCQNKTKIETKATDLPVITYNYDFESVIDKPGSLVIRNVTLFDGEKIHAKAVVVVKDSFIAQVCVDTDPLCPPAMPSDIDGQNGFLMPSLIDSEGHFTLSNEMLRDLLEDSKSSCTIKNEKRYPHVSKSLLVKEFSDNGLFEEVDAHGLIANSPKKANERGRSYPIPQSANFEKHLRFGVSTVFDMHTTPWPASYVRRSNGKWGNASNAEQRDLKKQFLVYADLFYSSMWAMPHNLQFHYYGIDPVYNIQPEGPWTEDDLKKWVLRRKLDGATHIKVFYETVRGVAKAPHFFTKQTLTSLTKIAHGMGLLVVSHMQDETLVESAVDADVDGFMHIPGDNRTLLSQQILKKMKQRSLFAVATLGALSKACDNPYMVGNMFKDVLNTVDILPYINALDEIRLASCRPPQPSAEYEIILRNVAAMADEGIPLLVGVDAGDDIEPSVEGLNLHAEIAIVKAALQKYSKNYSSNESATLYALKTATSNAAMAFKMHLENRYLPKVDPRGFVKKGYRADLLLLKNSPFDDIKNSLKIRSLWKAGYPIHRAMVRPNCIDDTCETRKIINRESQKACKK